MTSTAFNERGPKPSLQQLRTRQAEVVTNLPEFDRWIQQEAPLYQPAVAEWFAQIRKDQDMLFDLAERGAEAERRAAILEERLEDAIAKEQNFELEARRREEEHAVAQESVVELQNEVNRLQELLGDTARNCAGETYDRGSTLDRVSEFRNSTALSTIDDDSKATPQAKGEHGLNPVPKALLASAPLPATPAKPIDALNEVYLMWCRSAGTLAGRFPQFAQRVRENHAQVSVRPIYRDLDSPLRPIVFTTDPTGAAPAEFWLIEVDGERWLFPQPQSPHQFRDLAPVFDGLVPPKDLMHVQPALVRQVGSGFELEQSGAVA